MCCYRSGMTSNQKGLIVSILTAAVSAGVTYWKPAFLDPALLVLGLVLGWLHLSKPGDATPAELATKLASAVQIARATDAKVSDIQTELKK